MLLCFFVVSPHPIYQQVRSVHSNSRIGLKPVPGFSASPATVLNQVTTVCLLGSGSGLPRASHCFPSSLSELLGARVPFPKHQSEHVISLLHETLRSASSHLCLRPAGPALVHQSGLSFPPCPASAGRSIFLLLFHKFVSTSGHLLPYLECSAPGCLHGWFLSFSLSISLPPQCSLP